jgi:leucyl aminopeptidase
MKINFAESATPKTGAVVVGVHEKGKLSASARRIDSITKGALRRAVRSSKFSGKSGEMISVVAPAGTSLTCVILAGFGKSIDELECQNLGGRLVAFLEQAGEETAAMLIDDGSGAPSAADVALGARLRGYRFDKYRMKAKAQKDKKPRLATLTLHVKGATEARRAFAPLDKVADGVALTRDLVSEPPNVIFPKSFAAEVRKLSRLGVKVDVLGESKMRELRMRTLLAVGQGSEHESQLVVMHWNGAPKSKRPIAFVGKGVCFDSGGLSLKPAGAMEQMKWDMGGAGVVTGLMKALAGRKAKVNAVGVIGLVENMPSGGAVRPGDVITSMSGQTIEVLNTDAEGRLVLADALWYTQSRFKPKFMVDLATLTGAMIVSLGHEYAGVFSNNDDLTGNLIAAGSATGEKLWRLPLDKAYDKKLDCDIADMKNIGGRDAGSITAAQFLQRFVNEVPWAHLDIAGVTWSSKDAPTVPRGGTGFGVRLLDRLVRDNYEC